MPSARKRAVPSRAACAVAAAAGAVALVFASPVGARDDATPLVFRVADPPALGFEATALGRASHPVRLVVTNTGRQAAQVEPLAFRFRPVREGVAFACDEPYGEEPRWPATLDSGASFTITRQVSCETPLPGRYEVDVRGRPRGGADSDERTYGAFAIQIEPGANPPVRLPWESSLHAAASGTKEMRPTKDPNKARIVVALVNGTKSAITLTPLRAFMRVTRRGSTVAPCAEKGVDLAFSGTLAPGRTVTMATPLGCELPAEAIYDVAVGIGNASGARVHLANHSLRVGVLPPPPPRPEDSQPGKVIGGM